MKNASPADAISKIAAEIASLSGGCASFADSPDALDRWYPANIRAMARDLAAEVAALSDAEIEAIASALDAVCASDAWAEAEVAKRFRGGVVRFQIVAAVRRHPRAARFASLISAVESGSYTAKQLAFARRLADEI